MLTNENKKGPHVPPPPPEPVLTAIEKELKDAGPKRPDGSDTFVGFANVSSTPTNVTLESHTDELLDREQLLP